MAQDPGRRQQARPLVLGLAWQGGRFVSDRDDYARIEKAIARLGADYLQQPTLDQLAGHVGLSPFHFQRLFHRWAGVTPKRFLQYLTLEHAKQRLRASATVMQASFDAGLSGSSRLHDLFLNLEAATPGEYREGGAGLCIQWGVHETPFGACLIASTSRGVCGLGFICRHARAGSPMREEDLLARLQRDWPAARFARAPSATRRFAEEIFAGNPRAEGLSLFVRGTPFQVRVWRALLEVPLGCLTTYKAVGHAIGQPLAARAVGRAVGDNPIAWLIPCHRVIRGLGDVGGYRWGVPRKRAILGWEAAAQETEASLPHVDRWASTPVRPGLERS
jgi:AraC family transcriptional regulator, regulatory protein of adaptative response / methylated-DNA-[protein]-cysteine methyltransferase